MTAAATSFKRDFSSEAIEEIRQRVTQKQIKALTVKGKNPLYDSVVIAGNGIGALCFAARLARSDAFRGKVTIIAPPINETRRLIDGVSLRGRAADYICAALGVSHNELIQQITGHASGKPVCHRVTSSMAFETKDGWKFTKHGTWLGGDKGSDKPIIYGARNSRTTAGMWELMQGLDINYIEERVENSDQMRDHARGKKPLLVNVTYISTLLGNKSAPATSRKVVVVQAPFKVKPGGLTGPAESGSAYAPLIRRNGIIDVGFVTPFADPLSPKSSWYSILARVVDKKKGFDKDEELRIMTDELIGMSDALGLEVDDPSETLAAACVPSAPYTKPPKSTPGTLELKANYYGGNPAYYADGMISAAMGGLMGAEAVLAGDDPADVVWKAGKAIRFHNYLWWLETTKISGLAEALMRVNVNLAMAYPHSWGFSNWAAGA